MKHYLVQYDYTDDREGRMAIVDAHRGYLAPLGDAGVNLVSGARGPAEAPGAVFLLRAADSNEVQRIIDGDPFVKQGFVARTSVVEYIPMSGALAPAVRGDD